MDYFCFNCRTVSRNDATPPLPMRPGCRVGSLRHAWRPFPGGLTWKYRCGVAGCMVALEVVKEGGEPPDQAPATEAGGQCRRPEGHRWGAPT